MQKIVFIFFILFVFSYSVLAGEIYTQQDKGIESLTQKQIVIAFRDAKACRASCRTLFDSCQSGCRGSISQDLCLSGCANSYDWCLEDCDKVDYGK